MNNQQVIIVEPYEFYIQDNIINNINFDIDIYRINYQPLSINLDDYMIIMLESSECIICFDDTFNHCRIFNCRHTQCRNCLENYINHRNNNRLNIVCPICRAELFI